MKPISRSEAVKRYRKIDPVLTYADAWAWSVLDDSLKRHVIKVVGATRAIDVQFGNLLGWLRDQGKLALCRDLRDAIDAFNAEQDERRQDAMGR